MIVPLLKDAGEIETDFGQLVISRLLVRGLPALLYKRLVGTRQAIATGLLQTTSLSFLVAASQIGLQLGLITRTNEAALIGAGLLGALIFPPCTMMLLRASKKAVSLPEQT